MLRARLWLFNENLMVSGTIIISFTLTICVDSVNGTYICVCVCALGNKRFYFFLFVSSFCCCSHQHTTSKYFELNFKQTVFVL